MYGEFHEQPLDALKQMQVVNMVALTTLTRLALPKMLARRRGRILNVASLVGFQPGAPLAAVYYGTKSYVLSFSTGLARELKGTGVSVTALCPGPTRTAFEERAGMSATRVYKWALFPSAKAVAEAGYRGMLRRRSVVVPGFVTKIITVAGHTSPRAVALEVNRFLMRRA